MGVTVRSFWERMEALFLKLVEDVYICILGWGRAFWRCMYI